MDLFGDLPEPTSNASGVDFASKASDSVKSTKSEDDDSRSELKRKSDDHITSSSKKISRDAYQLQGYYAERKGEREEMQDAHSIIDNFMPFIENTNSTIYRLAYYGVFDGHGGVRAATHTAENLHVTLGNKFPTGDYGKVETDIKKCLVESYKKTDEDFLSLATKVKPSWKDGTTAVTILAINNTLYIANLGDSKAVLCRYSQTTKKYTAVPLTKDHSPATYEERIRIQKAGGSVREGRVMGVLEVSRSIGDGPYKKHGVICLPDVRRCQLTEQDRYILIACDGLWKTFSPESAIEFTNKTLEDDTIEGTEVKNEVDVRWETAYSNLATEAVRRLSADNVTVLLVRVGLYR